MRAACLTCLLPLVLLAGSVLAEEGAEPVASALEADDACAGGAGAAGCDLSLRQLRGEAVAAVSGDAQEALQLTSTFGEGVDYQASQACEAAELGRDSKGKIRSSFSLSRDGLAWRSETVVLSVDAQPTMFETIHPEWPIALRLSLDFEAGQNASIVIQGLKEPVPSSLHAGSKYCRAAKPACSGQPHCYVHKPAGDWAQLDNVIVQPASGVISINVTDIIDPELGSVQLWAVPAEVAESGTWATPEFTVRTWSFFNLGGGGGSDADDVEEFW